MDSMNKSIKHCYQNANITNNWDNDTDMSFKHFDEGEETFQLPLTWNTFDTFFQPICKELNKQKNLHNNTEHILSLDNKHKWNNNRFEMVLRLATNGSSFCPCEPSLGCLEVEPANHHQHRTHNFVSFVCRVCVMQQWVLVLCS